MFQDLKRCYIIAEIGGNFTTEHEAFALIDAAKDAGVDCVKLQTYRAETVTTKYAMFNMESISGVTQAEYFKRFEISEELHRKIIGYIQSKKLDWFSTPSHRTDVEMLLRLNIKALKVGADDANNLPFLVYMAKTGLPIVLSTGMCTLDEAKEAVDIILSEGNRNIVILHTVSGYPTYPEYVNLNVLNTYRREFPGFYIGFSDHTLTPLASITAAAMGADIIERHFTLDKNADGPDHIVSADPTQMKYIVDTIRKIEVLKGSASKEPVGPEIENRINNRKSIVTVKAIRKGERFTPENVDIKRPGSGIQPKYFSKIIGKFARKDMEPDAIISPDDIE
jgi:N-acetylneuraminate synthase